MATRDFHIGLISGTSVDAVDAVVARFDDDTQAASLIATRSEPPPAGLRDALLALGEADRRLSLAEFGALDQAVGEWFVTAANNVRRQADLPVEAIAAIGSHGQTVWHAPDAPYPFSLQIGAAPRIAAGTGCPVVSDFRNADLALGGQGAPLVCALHAALFSAADSDRAVVNIGGIANITHLPAGARNDLTGVTGFDTGPGNGLMDAWIHAHSGHDYDADGAWAAEGRIDRDLLERLLADPYFQRPPPKSTGREVFGLAWLRGHLNAMDPAPSAVDTQATLCELTARTIVDGIQGQRAGTPGALYICGGGIHNRHLMQRLEALAGCPVESTERLGVHPDWVEALAFAWLARQRVGNRPGNAPGVTGASGPAILGGWHAPPPDMQ